LLIDLGKDASQTRHGAAALTRVMTMQTTSAFSTASAIALSVEP